jgi:hypothetical protein
LAPDDGLDVPDWADAGLDADVEDEADVEDPAEETFSF